MVLEALVSKMWLIDKLLNVNIQLIVHITSISVGLLTIIALIILAVHAKTQTLRQKTYIAIAAYCMLFLFAYVLPNYLGVTY